MSATIYDWPTLSRYPAEMELGLRANTQVFVSELSGQVQTVELPGTRWTASFRISNLERADDAAELEALLAKLRGQANRLRLPVFSRRAPRGTWAGSPTVNNEVGSPTLSQTGGTLYVKNFTAGATVKKGDLFNLGANGQLLMNTADGTADGSGLLQLSVQPNIRTAPAHGTALVSTNPVIPQMILSDPHARWTHRAGDEADFAFDLIEVFA